MKILNNFHYTVRDYLAMIGILIPSGILYIFIEEYTILFLIVAGGIFAYQKNKYMGITSLIIALVISYVTNLIATSINIIITRFIDRTETQGMLIYLVLFIIISVIIAYTLTYFIKQLSGSYLSLSKKYLIFLSTFLLISFIVSYLIMPSEIAYSRFAEVTIITVVLFAFVAIAIISFSFILLRQIQYKNNMEEIESYYKYTLQIENINHEMRKFRHDYVNILTTLSEFIRDDDMPGLREYFNKEIMPIQDSLQTKSIKINGIDNLKVREIKGLVTTKILQAQEKNIRISIEVPEHIDHIDMNTISLSRIIGIIIDNAIEASEKVEDDPNIIIAFIKAEASIYFVVMNKCAPDTPQVHHLFKEGYSTKGENRGLGLATLKEITDTTSNVLLDTVIDNGYFVQKVEILDTEA
ncbi:MAG TPA: GHKL domain-containing protein [Staphylococcus auricularis]|uniref:GHKL domain-containing protein n=4 Tax=Staphylococcus auricularis TaxID=29379 RepID=A0AAW7M548_9STAP|nr:GHKL domain-containing protein [Staphylococcus auricularis]MBM0867110.1 GHKL domain-containing protein [Staphylococcus auricularis]MDC6328009.1 GHKL domain-containing protein [Staphylococcus auricularis]MDN4532139.1 GHKL domain-containing protein [Staphylococcus auricularis]HJE01827.1 GHKL domain-containing protein [Staphylococcus auricularis]